MISIENILKSSKTIAIIGLSDKSDRPSYQVAEYFLSQNFTIIPVNPTIESVFGIKSYSTFASIPSNITIDIVDIFRRSSEVLSIVQEIINSGRKPIIWLQVGILNQEAEDLAKKNGLEVITGLCLMKAHERKSTK